MFLRHHRSRTLLPAGLSALALVVGACVGSSPPPRRDLSTALERTASGDSMFEFSLWGRIAIYRPDGQSISPGAAAEFHADGSARSGRGYRMTVRKRPALWYRGPSASKVPVPGEGPSGVGEVTATGAGVPASWLVLEETPGAVRAPAQPLWFSGRSGAMDPFGALAYALPPLGSPDTVFARLTSFVSRFGDPELSGQSEVRGHPVDIYSLAVVSERAQPPKEVVEARRSGTPLTSPTPEPGGSPSPSPTSLDGSLRAPISEAAWLLVWDDAPAGELTAAIEADVRYSLVARVLVDQIDNRVRRVEVSMGVRSPGSNIRVEAASDYWGFDVLGEFKIPVDTTLVSPEGQAAIRSAGFPVTAPSTMPPGLEFTGLERRPGADPCEPLSISYTGRGRAGHIRLTEVPAACGPSLPSPASPEAQSPSPISPSGRESFTLTDTPLGSRVSLWKHGESAIAYREIGNSWVTARAEGGISVEELLLTLDALTPLSVPIPHELSLPLPREGPERR